MGSVLWIYVCHDDMGGWWPFAYMSRALLFFWTAHRMVGKRSTGFSAKDSLPCAWTRSHVLPYIVLIEPNTTRHRRPPLISGQCVIAAWNQTIYIFIYITRVLYYNYSLAPIVDAAFLATTIPRRHVISDLAHFVPTFIWFVFGRRHGAPHHHQTTQVASGPHQPTQTSGAFSAPPIYSNWRATIMVRHHRVERHTMCGLGLNCCRILQPAVLLWRSGGIITYLHGTIVSGAFIIYNMRAGSHLMNIPDDGPITQKKDQIAPCCVRNNHVVISA